MYQRVHLVITWHGTRLLACTNVFIWSLHGIVERVRVTITLLGVHWVLHDNPIPRPRFGAHCMERLIKPDAVAICS